MGACNFFVSLDLANAGYGFVTAGVGRAKSLKVALNGAVKHHAHKTAGLTKAANYMQTAQVRCLKCCYIIHKCRTFIYNKVYRF